jgi:hypothetical protein
MATSVAQSWQRDFNKSMQQIESMRFPSISMLNKAVGMREIAAHTFAPLRNAAHVKGIVARQKAPPMATSVTRSSQIFLGNYGKVLN